MTVSSIWLQKFTSDNNKHFLCKYISIFSKSVIITLLINEFDLKIITLKVQMEVLGYGFQLTLSWICNSIYNMIFSLNHVVEKRPENKEGT